jgi:hypothetical protein
VLRTAVEKLQRRESNPLFSGYEPDGSPLAFAAINESIRRTCTGLLSVTDGPQRYLCLDGMKLDTHPRLAPGKIGFADRRLVDFAMCVELVRYVGVAPTRRASQARMLLLHHHLIAAVNGSSGRSRTDMVFITKEVHCWLCHGGIKNTADRRSAPARTCTSTLRLRTAACITLTPRELKRLHHAGAAPTHTVWKTVMRTDTSMMLVDWWLNSVSRRTLLGFSEVLICLSYSAVKWSLREVTLPGQSVIG